MPSIGAAMRSKPRIQETKPLMRHKRFGTKNEPFQLNNF